MLNPIEHARTKEDAFKYKSEPYVIVADIYSHPHLIGRGGWSWYTGSASWYFVAGIKYILGLNKKGENIEINPKFPNDWNSCHIKFEIENTTYVINMVRNQEENIVQNENNNYNENIYKDKKQKIILYVDNELVEGNIFKINLDSRTHIVDVKLI